MGTKISRLNDIFILSRFDRDFDIYFFKSFKLLKK